MELIDREKLKDEIAVLFERNAGLIDEWLANTVDDVIDEMPSIDAVPVVRCKECKHKNICFSEVAMTNKYQTTTLYEPIEWCSKGKRKES